MTTVGVSWPPHRRGVIGVIASHHGVAIGEEAATSEGCRWWLRRARSPESQVAARVVMVGSLLM